jgi:hypothetical protein
MDSKKNANLFLSKKIRDDFLAKLERDQKMVNVSDADKNRMADEIVRQHLSTGEPISDDAENDNQKINCRIRGYEKNLISDFVENFRRKGGLVYGKKPTISNLTVQLWMLVCGRDLGLSDPVSRSDLNLSLLTLRNLGSNLNALMRAYNQGSVIEPFDGGEELILNLQVSVNDLKKDLEEVVRLANGNHQKAVSRILGKVKG